MKTFYTFLAVLIGVSAKSGIYNDDGSIQQAPILEARGYVPPSSTLERDTNAARFRRGLPPLKPKGRNGAPRARRSALPCTTKAGVIQVFKQGASIGYISHSYDGQNSYTYTASLASAQTFSLPIVGTGCSSVFDITAVNPPDAANPQLGAVGGSGGYRFAPNTLGYAYLTGTSHIPANSPPSFSGTDSIQALGYNAPKESQIWSIASDNTLTATWTNTDSTQVTAQSFYDPSVNFLAIVGDFQKFTSTFPGEGAYLVTLKFVP